MSSSPPQRLRAHRVGVGQSLAEYGKRIGCAASSLSMIERGQRFPGLSIALGIQRVCGIAPEEWERMRAALVHAA